MKNLYLFLFLCSLFSLKSFSQELLRFEDEIFKQYTKGLDENAKTRISDKIGRVRDAYNSCLKVENVLNLNEKEKLFLEARDLLNFLRKNSSSLYLDEKILFEISGFDQKMAGEMEKIVLACSMPNKSEAVLGALNELHRNERSLTIKTYYLVNSSLDESELLSWEKFKNDRITHQSYTVQIDFGKMANLYPDIFKERVSRICNKRSPSLNFDFFREKSSFLNYMENK
ncbi:hypothetical protein [Bowmanella denitrificans]|uniref:hypothetical protein n=1 Tax=Bowmanella denitrificans TaxID=366582 RepID=UPI000C9B86AB|nr:hypothetical protein [Bowmanella denitrificans]